MLILWMLGSDSLSSYLSLSPFCGLQTMHSCHWSDRRFSHPKLQANLADFFLRIASSGKRILFETHSEHLINRLRRRIAEDPTGRLKDDVNILFVRPPTHFAGASVEPLKVDEHGVIEN